MTIVTLDFSTTMATFGEVLLASDDVQPSTGVANRRGWVAVHGFDPKPPMLVTRSPTLRVALAPRRSGRCLCHSQHQSPLPFHPLPGAQGKTRDSGLVVRLRSLRVNNAILGLKSRKKHPFQIRAFIPVASQLVTEQYTKSSVLTPKYNSYKLRSCV